MIVLCLLVDCGFHLLHLDCNLITRSWNLGKIGIRRYWEKCLWSNDSMLFCDLKEGLLTDYGAEMKCSVFSYIHCSQQKYYRKKAWNLVS